jgi:hypothetical protein
MCNFGLYIFRLQKEKWLHREPKYLCCHVGFYFYLFDRLKMVERYLFCIATLACVSMRKMITWLIFNCFCLSFPFIMFRTIWNCAQCLKNGYFYRLAQFLLYINRWLTVLVLCHIFHGSIELQCYEDRFVVFLMVNEGSARCDFFMNTCLSRIEMHSEKVNTTVNKKVNKMLTVLQVLSMPVCKMSHCACVFLHTHI